MARNSKKNDPKTSRSPGRFAKAIIETESPDASAPTAPARPHAEKHHSSRRDTTKIRRVFAAIQGFFGGIGAYLANAFGWLIAQRWLPLAIVLTGSLVVALGARFDAPEAAAKLSWENTTWFGSPPESRRRRRGACINDVPLLRVEPGSTSQHFSSGSPPPASSGFSSTAKKSSSRSS